MRGVIAVCGLFGLLALATWHVRPVLVWHLDVVPRLEGHANAARMEVETRTSVSEPPTDWTRLEVDNLTLHVPILAEYLERCETCIGECRLEIEGVRFRGKRIDLTEHQAVLRTWELDLYSPGSSTRKT